MKKINFIAACLLVACGIIVISCNQDGDYNEDFYGLDVLYHTCATKSTLEDMSFIQNEDDVIKHNKKYPKEDDCCYLTVIMEQWIASKGNFYFGSGCEETAEQHYYKLKEDWREKNPGWKEGDSVKNKQFMNYAGDMFGSEEIFAETGTDAEKYFSDKRQRKNVAVIYVEKNEPGRGVVGHIAYVTNCTENKIYFKGEPFCGKNSMKISGENGWKIVGVINKR